MKIDMYTLKECIKAWLKGFFKILTGRGHFDPSLMERVKSCYQEDGRHYKHVLKRSVTNFIFLPKKPYFFSFSISANRNEFMQFDIIYFTMV